LWLTLQFETSNDVGEEMAETIEDQIADLQSQIARKDEELSQQERELNESRETLAEILSMWCMYEKLNMLD
jgi:flagellar biosynthesis chaperone FliJ